MFAFEGVTDKTGITVCITVLSKKKKKHTQFSTEHCSSTLLLTENLKQLQGALPVHARSYKQQNLTDLLLYSLYS